MLFNSYVFLMAFLPSVWLIYFGLNKCGRFRLGQAALILASFVFYSYQNRFLCLLLGVSILFNYLIHCLLTSGEGTSFRRKLLMICGLAVNFGLLFYYKYFDFAIENINRLTGSSLALQNIVLPLGISFFTFQQVSFVIDSYRGEMGRYRLLDYALFVSFFPQLVAGPIVLHGEMIPQFTNIQKKKINYANMLSGSEYLILGLAKKVLLADAFGRFADAGLDALGHLNSLSAVSVILAFTLEIYFDFSGYCDMAMGIGKLFNIDIPANFRSPYKAVNISEFWKRWHITLTRFLTTYLYIPLGGSRVKTWKIYRNVMIVFALSGLWHGADWSFVAWGMMHGVMMVLYRMNKRRADALPKWLSWLVTFVFLNVAWTFFYTESFVLSFQLLKSVVSGGTGGFMQEMVSALCEKNILVVMSGYFVSQNGMHILTQILAAIWLIGGTAVCAAAPSSHQIIERKCRSQWYFFVLAVIFFCSVVRLSEVSKFIYFNF